MNSEQLESALRIGIQAVQSGGALAMKWYKQLDKLKTEIKDDASPVSQVDTEVELLIKKAILTQFPDHNFLGEEFGLEENSDHQEKEGYTRVLDPIDGTRNYLRGLDQGRGVLLALVDAENKVLIGISFRPACDDLLYASVGKRAFDIEGRQLQLSDRSFADAIVTHSRAKYFHEFSYEKQLHALSTSDAYVVSVGATIASYHDLLYGKIDGVIVLEGSVTKFYDNAPFILLVQEAGGRVSNREATQVTPEKSSVVASNSSIHTQVLDLLKPAPLGEVLNT